MTDETATPRSLPEKAPEAGRPWDMIVGMGIRSRPGRYTSNTGARTTILAPPDGASPIDREPPCAVARR